MTSPSEYLEMSDFCKNCDRAIHDQSSEEEAFVAMDAAERDAEIFLDELETQDRKQRKYVRSDGVCNLCRRDPDSNSCTSCGKHLVGINYPYICGGCSQRKTDVV